jgi:enhancing lycopene biosynthesis protein 2
MKESRNVLVESARIARGKINALSELSVSDYDGLLLPGGFGAAKNLSDWAFKGPKMKVLEGIREVILKMVDAGKPIGALCISPVILAKTLEGSKVTIGSDPNDGKAVEELGANHIKTSHEEIVIDNTYKIISSPCYMLDANILQIESGADKVVKAMLKMMD